MWSIGVITYSLLCGEPPFNAETEKELYQKILKGQYEFYEDQWKDIGMLAKDFIHGLLALDPQDRLTPE
jgi:serine/threonine protein kinase